MSDATDSDRDGQAPAADLLAAAGPAGTTTETELPPGAGGWSPQRVTLITIAVAVVIWLLIKGADDPRKFAVASGFTLIFGLMRVVNMAHGSLYLFGGYLALEMQDRWFKEQGGSGLG